MAHSLSQTNWAESMRCGGGGRGFSFSLPAEMLKASSACGGSQGWHGRMEEEEEEEEEVVVVVGEGVILFYWFDMICVATSSSLLEGAQLRCWSFIVLRV